MKEAFPLERAYKILQKNIPDSTKGKREILDFCNWILDRNNNLSGEKKICCYLRENVNIGFTILEETNKNKSKYNNFLVIKLEATDVIDLRDFLHLDFYLGRKGYKKEINFLIQREKLPSRWCVRAQDLGHIKKEEIQNITKYAYEKRFGKLIR